MPHTKTGNLNYQWASQLIDGLCCAGVKHAVISPGARSTPLVLACHHHPDIQPHIVIDERCAAFFALGLAKSSTTPVILIATSGSAPAHWLPAVIEASHSKLPLLLLSADRPPELQGTGANQTTQQNQLFSGHLRFHHNAGAPRPDNTALQALHNLGLRAVAQASWPNPGPVHLNLPFHEPLIPETDIPPVSSCNTVSMALPDLTINPAQLKQLLTILPAGDGIIVCGPVPHIDADFNHAISSLATTLGAPILADPLSGLRWGSHAQKQIICQYDTFLRHSPTLPKVDWILRFGAPPVSKVLQKFIQHTNCKQILCDPYGDWPDPFHNLNTMVRSNPTALCLALSKQVVTRGKRQLLDCFQQLDTKVLTTISSQDSLPIEACVVQALFEQLANESCLLAGNSMPIRHVDSWSNSGSKTIHICGNRGISGIDGHLSTLAGLSEGSTQKCIALVGDLTFYHDMNGLAALQQRDIVIVLLNNGGGGIFGYLPHHKLESYEQYWSTPIDINFEHAAATYGIEYQTCHTPEVFAQQLSAALSRCGPQLIEVSIERDLSIQQHQDFWRQTP